jgi:hypothetical protein
MGTGVVAALVEGYLFSLFPGEEGVLAVGAVILCLILAESFLLLKELAADLAEELGSLLAVVVVEVGMRGLAGRAASAFRDPRGAGRATSSVGEKCNGLHHLHVRGADDGGHRGGGTQGTANRSRSRCPLRDDDCLHGYVPI